MPLLNCIALFYKQWKISLQMDNLTLHIGANYRNRRRAHEICKLMKKTKTLLNATIQEATIGHRLPNMMTIRNIRIRAEDKARRAENVYDEVLNDFARSGVALNALITRFGYEMMSNMVTSSFQNLMVTINRAERFCLQAIRNSKDIRLIEMRELHTARLRDV